MATIAAAEIQVHGHRGARAVRPENSLPAFEYALAQGVDVLELDMAVTKDNVVVVSHDETMNPAYCEGPEGATRVIREMTFAELQKWDCGKKTNPAFPKQLSVPGTRVPTLDAVFEMAKNSNVEFNIETKMSPAHPEWTPSPEAFVKMALLVVRKHRLEKRVMVQSFDFRTLHEMKSQAPEIRRSALITRGDLVDEARKAGASIISPIFTLVTPEKVAAAHAAGLQVVPWTPNKEEEWAKMVAAKVDAIISDDPAALIAYLRRGR